VPLNDLAKAIRRWTEKKECALSAVACCPFHPRPCFTHLFHCGSFFSPLCCNPALSVFASKCQGECHAVKAARCDLGDPGWGDSALSFVASCTFSVAHGDFVVFVSVVVL